MCYRTNNCFPLSQSVRVTFVVAGFERLIGELHDEAACQRSLLPALSLLGAGGWLGRIGKHGSWRCTDVCNAGDNQCA